MSLRKFVSNDLFNNTLVTYPKFQFKVVDGKIYLNNQPNAFSKYIDLNIEDRPRQNGVLDFSAIENSGIISII